MAPAYIKAANKTSEFVILLHGLARKKRSLSKLERHLDKEGFRVVNTGYPSRKKTIQELSTDVIPKAIEKCLSLGAGKIHFVTHSIFFIPGKSDGKVSVESAKLLGMKDFLVVHKTHSFIMNDKMVLSQITAFIKNGMFNKDYNAGRHKL